MKADIVLTSHPEIADVLGREARAERGQADVFVDPTELDRIVADARAEFETELAKARRGANHASGDAPADPAAARRVKTEFLHAWRGYRRYAWGHDELRPLSRASYDWYGTTLLMTPVDALDTLVLLDLKPEVRDDLDLIDTHLDFDKDISVKTFEITIRLLGGLLSAYELTGDPRLLGKARDLADRLLPAFNSPTGLPYAYVNLRTGAVSGADTNPAETGTLILEFGALSRLTGDRVYFDKAKRALTETFRRAIGDRPGRLRDRRRDRRLDRSDLQRQRRDRFHYEYLWKCWRLFGDQDCLSMWRASIDSVDRYLADDLDGSLWYGHADMTSGRRTATQYGALDAFFPGLLALSGDVDRAARLQDSSMRMWRLEGDRAGGPGLQDDDHRLAGLSAAARRSSNRRSTLRTTRTIRNTWTWVGRSSPT